MSARMYASNQQPVQQPMPFPQVIPQPAKQLSQVVAQPAPQQIQQPVPEQKQEQVQFNDEEQKKKQPAYQTTVFDMERIGTNLSNLIKDLTGKSIDFTNLKQKHAVNCNLTVAAIRKEFLENYAKFISYMAEDPSRSQLSAITTAFMTCQEYASLLYSRFGDIDLKNKEFNDIIIEYIKKTLNLKNCLVEPNVDEQTIRETTLNKLFLKYYNNKYHKIEVKGSIRDLNEQDRKDVGKKLSETIRNFSQASIEFYNLPFDRVVELDGNLKMNKDEVDALFKLGGEVTAGVLKDFEVAYKRLYALFANRPINVENKVKSLYIYKWIKMHTSEEIPRVIQEYQAFIKDYETVLNDCMTLMNSSIEDIVTRLKDPNGIYGEKKFMDIAFSILKRKVRFHTHVKFSADGKTSYQVSDKYAHYQTSAEKRFHVIREEPFECVVKCFHETLRVAGNNSTTITTTINRLASIGHAILMSDTFDNQICTIIGTYLFLFVVDLVRDFQRKTVVLQEGIIKKKK